MKVALVYDRVNKWGGAERVLLALHRIFPDAPLFTSVYNKDSALWAKVFDVKTSFLQKLPFAKSSHELYAVLMPMAFESFDFSNYDLVISVTSEAAKGIITKPNTIHICYMLTPTRYLWSGYDLYFKNFLLRFLSKPVVSYLRSWDKIASKRPDKIIAISTEVSKRIKKYYDRNSEIIFPPVDEFKENSKEENLGYFLIVSRLVYYKRIDIAIKAFNKLNLPLKIIGIGSEEESLKKLANSNIEFLGNLTDEKLSVYYKNCRGLIFPGVEDFGLVMVEAQSFGKPVISFKGGGATDIIREGITGEFFETQTPESLIGILEKFESTSYNSNLCRENALRFSFENFKDRFLQVIKK
ncbi:MAG: glycosyltransferase [Actinobacteria bacterium]|nr:glycosyltransferase [Actinomycetota bacterium]